MSSSKPEKVVLVLAQLFPPTGGPGVQRISKLVKYLPEFGWRPVVITADTVDPPRDDDLLRDVRDADVIRVRARLYAWARRGRSLLRRLVRYFCVPDVGLLWLPGAYRAARREGAAAAAVLATGGPFSTFPLAILVARRLGVPLVLDVRDPWTENPRRYPRRWYVGWRDALERWLERYSFRRGDRIVGVNDALRDRLLLPDDAHYEAIPNGFDPVDFTQDTTRGLAEDSAPRRIVYVGTLLDEYGIQERLLPALSSFYDRAEERRSVRTDFFGDNLPFVPPELEGLVHQHAYVPHREAIAAMTRADVLLLLTAGHRHDQTGKMFEYLAARRPILLVGHPESAAAVLLREHPAARCVAPGDAEAFVAALRALLDGPTDFELPPHYDRYHRRHQAGEFAALLDGALAGGGR